MFGADLSSPFRNEVESRESGRGSRSEAKLKHSEIPHSVGLCNGIMGVMR